MHRALNLSVGQLGPVLGISQLVMTIMLPIWGYATDRFSRKRLLVAFTGFWGAWTLVISFVDTFPQLMVVRLLSSLGLGLFAPAAFSLVSDLFPDHKRGRVAGTIAALDIMGSLAAFGILPGIAERGADAWRAGFILMGGASVVTGILLLLILEPIRGAGEPEVRDVITADSASRYLFTWHDLRHLLKIRSWWCLLLLEVWGNIGVGIVIGWSFTWLEGLGLGESAFLIVGLMALATILGAVMFGWVGDRMERRFPHYGRLTMILIGTILLLPTVLLFVTLDPSRTILLTLLGALFGLGLSVTGTSLQWPMAQAILLPELRGSGRAVMSMVSGTATAVMLTLSGTVADQVGIAQMLLLLVPLPAFLAILTLLPLFYTYPHDRQALHQTLTQRRQTLTAPSV